MRSTMKSRRKEIDREAEKPQIGGTKNDLNFLLSEEDKTMVRQIKRVQDRIKRIAHQGRRTIVEVPHDV